jgi:hypothetical protein
MLTRLLFLKLCLFLLLASSYSKADCLPDATGKNFTGLCTPGVTITEDTQIDIVEEDFGTEIVTTTTTTVTNTEVTVTNPDSGDLLDGTNGYVSSGNEGDMDIDWGGQGPASMPTGNGCYGLGTDKCAAITGSGNTTSTMGVPGMGTTFIQTVDFSELNISNGGEVTYSIEVDKQDDQDRIYMHVTGLNGNSQVFSGTDILSESGVSTGYQSYNGSFDFSGVLNRVTIEVGGRDINLAVGPVFDDVSVNVFYNVINTIITQQITTIEEIYYLNLLDTEINFAEEVFEFNDIATNDIGEIEFMPFEPEYEEVTYESVEMEMQELEMDFDYVEVSYDVTYDAPVTMDLLPPPEMNMDFEMPINIETVSIEIEMEMNLELPSLEDMPPPPDMMASVEEIAPPMEMEDVPPPMETEPEVEIEVEPVETEVEETKPQMEEVQEEPEMTEPEPEEAPEEVEEVEETKEPEEAPEEVEEVEEETKEEPKKEEKKQEPKKEPKKQPSAKEKAASKIVKKIDDKARYDDAAQTKTLIVMQILGNTKSFFDTQKLMPDLEAFFTNETIPDNIIPTNNIGQYLMFGGSDSLMDKMIDSQYK